MVKVSACHPQHWQSKQLYCVTCNCLHHVIHSIYYHITCLAKQSFFKWDVLNSSGFLCQYISDTELLSHSNVATLHAGDVLKAIAILGFLVSCWWSQAVNHKEGDNKYSSYVYLHIILDTPAGSRHKRLWHCYL